MFRNHVFTLSVLSLLGMGQAVTALAADTCQPVFDAITELVPAPSHSYSTGVVNGKPSSTEPQRHGIRNLHGSKTTAIFPLAVMVVVLLAAAGSFVATTQ